MWEVVGQLTDESVLGMLQMGDHFITFLLNHHGHHLGSHGDDIEGMGFAGALDTKNHPATISPSHRFTFLDPKCHSTHEKLGQSLPTQSQF